MRQRDTDAWITGVAPTPSVRVELLAKMARRGRPPKFSKLSTLNGVVDATPVVVREKKIYSRLDEPVSPKGLAKMLDVSPATVKRHAKELPKFSIGNKTRFIPREVIEFLRAKKAGGGSSGSSTPPTST